MATFTFTTDFGGEVDFSLTDQSNFFNLAAYGMTGAVTNVSVTLQGLNHTSLGDLDMLLVAPDFVSNLAFWSDAGAGTNFSGNVTISDTGATQLPDNAGILSSGTYKPADFGELEDSAYYATLGNVLHAGPQGSGTFANAFSGLNGNGNWVLQIADDNLAADTGSLSGFQLKITTSRPIVALNGSTGNDTLFISESVIGSGHFIFNGLFPVGYTGVSGFEFDGGLGNDSISGSSGVDVLTGGRGRDSIAAGLGNDILVFKDNDVVAGEVLNGGGGTDTLRVAANGMDFSTSVLTSLEKIVYLSTATVGPTGDEVIFRFDAAQFGGGVSLSATIDGNSTSNFADTLRIDMNSMASLNLSGLSFVDFSQPSDIVTVQGDDDAENIIGTNVKDEISGEGGNDILNGGLGADFMRGGNGSDTYFANVANDVVIESSSSLVVGGNDLVNFTGTSGTFILSDDVERLTLGGTSAINGTGNTLSNTIKGNSAANILNGGTDFLADVLSGGLGNDTYIINSSNDNIVELAGGGLGDRAKASVSFVLAAGDNVEFLETTNAALATAINLTGNEIAQTITGNAGANVLKGAGGKDVLDGRGGVDTADFSDKTSAVVATLNGAAATNVTVGAVIEDSVRNIENLIGGTALDNLTGDGLANILNGGADALADNLRGGLGNDTYIINSATDNIIELVGGGTADRVNANVSFALAAGDNIEILGATNPSGFAALNFTGNEFAQSIFGTRGANILNGGIDALRDTLVGDLGNDTYIINSSNDDIIEGAGQGIDRAKTSVSFALAAGDNIEFLETTNAAGVGAINLTGNEITQTITGDAGANILDGGIDNFVDILIGGLGNDTYIINFGNDNIVENVGGGTADKVIVNGSYELAAGDNIEFLQLNTSVNSVFTLTGNEIGQSIVGSASGSIIAGRGGNDRLTGSAGSDNFEFDVALNATTNVDVITDFSIVEDLIVLDVAVFTALVATGVPLDASQFKNLTISGGAVDGTDRILYDDLTGAVFYDADGLGGTVRIQFATLTNAPTVTAADFFVG